MVSNHSDPMWFRALDRFGVATTVMIFCGVVLWYAGGWTGTNIVLPAVQRNLSIMDSVVATQSELASAVRTQARMQEKIVILIDKIHTDQQTALANQQAMMQQITKIQNCLAGVRP